MPKDNFSKGAASYAKFRPDYPKKLFQLINSLVTFKTNCWDCGTGNGQLACELAKSFKNVYATDISQRQIDQADQQDNIHYSVQPAESTIFPDDLFDLVMVGQAIHWFDFDKFYTEVRRTCKPDALLVITGYSLLRVDEAMDPVLDDFYHNRVGPYWDQERSYIEGAYQTIPFPFEEIAHDDYLITCKWTLEHLIGYLNTWSAVKHFTDENGENPVDQIAGDLSRHWGKEKVKSVQFPLLLRVGKV